MRYIHCILHTVSCGIIKDGFLEINNGKITAVGPMSMALPGQGDVDLTGGHITPGLIDTHTCLGLKEDSLRYEGNDWNETGMPVAPQLRAIDGFNPDDRAVEYALAGGVTTVGVSPGNANVIGGQIAAVRLCRDQPENMVLDPFCAMKFALGELVKRKNAAPVTRMAIGAMLRDTLNSIDTESSLCALRPILEGKKKAFFHAQRSDDILWAAHLCQTQGMQCVIVHGADAALVSPYLKEMGIPVILGSLLLTPADYETRNLDLNLPVLLDEAGVSFALSTDHHMSPIQALSVTAALAVREGLSYERALEAITLFPAKLLGVDNLIGSLEKGKDADIVIWSGDPFSYTSRVEAVLICGQHVFLRSKHCETL